VPPQPDIDSAAPVAAMIGIVDGCPFALPNTRAPPVLPA
jgi:hypothetical protein